MTSASRFVSTLMLAASVLATGCAAGLPTVGGSEGDGKDGQQEGPATAEADRRVIPAAATPPAGAAVVAIVIDDCGESVEQIVPFLGIPAPISFGILPWHDSATESARILTRAGRETLAHMPMEPHDPRWLENEWFLRSGMEPAQIRERLERALQKVPTATGMNNHMGSRFSADEQGMYEVMKVLAERNMYYLDSRTSRASKAREAAASAGTKFLSRDVFLDNEDDVEKISAQISLLVETAQKNGCALGIGHARSKTAAAIMNFVRARDPAVVLVPAGRLFDHCPSIHNQNQQE